MLQLDYAIGSVNDNVSAMDEVSRAKIRITQGHKWHEQDTQSSIKIDSNKIH